MLDHFAEQMERMFDDFGLGRSLTRSSQFGEITEWRPRVDITQRKNELCVRADLPGMSKDDVKVDITHDVLTIQRERRREHEEEGEGGEYRRELSYGSFYRAIPLPDGAMTDEAKATFKDGVLEITMPAPPEQVTRGRRLEISEGSSKSK
jgi:HSP20 family protein